MVNDIGRKGLDRSNSVVAAVLSGFANGCEFCHALSLWLLPVLSTKEASLCAERGEWQLPPPVRGRGWHRSYSRSKGQKKAERARALFACFRRTIEI